MNRDEFFFFGSHASLYPVAGCWMLNRLVTGFAFDMHLFALSHFFLFAYFWPGYQLVGFMNGSTNLWMVLFLFSLPRAFLGGFCFLPSKFWVAVSGGQGGARRIKYRPWQQASLVVLAFAAMDLVAMSNSRTRLYVYHEHYDGRSLLFLFVSYFLWVVLASQLGSSLSPNLALWVGGATWHGVNWQRPGWELGLGNWDYRLKGQLVPWCLGPT